MAMNETICVSDKESSVGAHMSGWVPRLLGGLCLSLALGLLGGCASSTGSSESIDHGRGGTARQPVTHGQYRVQRGDTLYSIAFRYGWDWKELAAYNRIPAPYTIRVGQPIRFGRGSAAAAPRTAANARPASAARNPAPVSNPQPVLAASQAPQAAPPAAPVAVPAVRSAGGWAWPANGELIALFSSNSSLNKGIDIGGDIGQPVLAASAGSVVYAGSGLRGYGELIIIKHNDTYVSAYGHNRRLLVREGQQVKAGERIAEMGATGTDRVKLHFEIRRQGKPVDPLQYLPRR